MWILQLLVWRFLVFPPKLACCLNPSPPRNPEIWEKEPYLTMPTATPSAINLLVSLIIVCLLIAQQHNKFMVGSDVFMLVCIFYVKAHSIRSGGACPPPLLFWTAKIFLTFTYKKLNGDGVEPPPSPFPFLFFLLVKFLWMSLTPPLSKWFYVPDICF